MNTANLAERLLKAADEIEQSDSTMPGYVELFREAANSVVDLGLEVHSLTERITVLGNDRAEAVSRLGALSKLYENDAQIIGRLMLTNVEAAMALESVSKEFYPCENCEETGVEIGTDGDACRVCGGYGFNPGGDIRDAFIQTRTILAKLAGKDHIEPGLEGTAATDDDEFPFGEFDNGKHWREMAEPDDTPMASNTYFDPPDQEEG